MKSKNYAGGIAIFGILGFWHLRKNAGPYGTAQSLPLL
jgi:hypothetical protein